MRARVKVALVAIGALVLATPGPAGAASPDPAVPHDFATPAVPIVPLDATASSDRARPADPLSAGDAAFRERDDPRRLAEAVARYREATRLRAGDPVALLRLARAEAFRALSTEAEAAEAWSASARAGEAALRLLVPAFAQAVDRGEGAAAVTQVGEPGAEALYWLALGTMGFAQTRGLSAVLSVRAQARAMMERAAQLNDRIDSGGPPRALGTWLASLPAAAGGGAAAARKQFERARALAPQYQLTRVQEAQTLSVLLQDRAGFQARLDEVLAFDDSRAPEVGPENRLAKRRARTLLARRDRLF